MRPTNNTHTVDKNMLGVFRYSRRAIGLVWQTSPSLTIGIALATLISGLLPAAMAYVGQLIVDAVVAAMQLYKDSKTLDYRTALNYVVLEGILVIATAAAQRSLAAQQAILRLLLGQKVNTMILEKAQTLSLAHFEDSEFYDKLIRARRDASSRPLALVNKTFGLLQNAITLTSFSILLWQFSPWVLVLLVAGALPSFIAEAKFSGDAFRMSRWRSPEFRHQNYVETLLAREDHIKEVRLYQLGRRFLQRYRDIFVTIFSETKRLILRRESWGFALGIIGTLVFYGAYGWIVTDTVKGAITLGQMTMYLLLFKQGQSAVSASLTSISGMYEDNLYLSNLYEYLEQPTTKLLASEEDDTLEENALKNSDLEAENRKKGPKPNDGIRFEGVTFHYPGAIKPALSNIDLHITPGQSLAIVGENGSGKTTLIKLLTRLYEPSEGRILLDGLDLKSWDETALLTRIGVIFQDFVRYQFIVGENIGAGDDRRFDDEEGWKQAAQLGKASDFIGDLEQGYQTQLGRWFKGGQELSGGQWQKIALARAFMRQDADILVLDEPTAAMDAQAEATIFQHFQEHTKDKMAILISHRFSTVRLAHEIIVMEHGEIKERGTHESLLEQKGQYAHLFALQAKGYR
ncbi:ATP-binding cassette domain-containing protein [Marinomonas mediterranea]|jgi:ABC-type multidrug transport system, ATPase and permease components|uniref:Xenobiotic-transporting ATPase n=1 Tax=Marinomonas mediterranea (strain ATCC 700492 / JCM 21426 / NBRC 103028 / MMB-1) TaxID=717774 RepID=F2JYM1_MARM1|nr:ABC transporter ATP-binding protein [Marinomonas mediterranea]ADZ93150.1 Xenobiotic-transporting ATPase [Marinomonas mediterranea MMB-1]WCN15115.1 ATP-binding cassette domain-containing protein [Marinomonas mediterranea]WCN19158.1 ATP-binding cassette domain-containing protein [Marinomonas mediterranea MMB-1]